MNFKFAPNLFLEVIELEWFKTSLDSLGFRKSLLQNSEAFGLIRNNQLDPSFLNGKVEIDVDTPLSEKTIKIRELNAIDSFGNFIYSPIRTQIIVPNDEEWYWVKVRHIYSNIEEGTFSIDATGNLVGTLDAKLLSRFRGNPNFPTRVKFINSAENILEYDVLQVIDDQNAILQHPALNGGSSEFEPETGLKLVIVGTFTPGIVIPIDDKFPFQYDSYELELIEETVYNTKPSSVSGIDFFLARIRLSSGIVTIQDKRVEYWKTKANQELQQMPIASNPLIGVENTKFSNIYTDGSRNIVEIAWGLRSQNWTLSTTSNTLSIESGLGGKFKTTSNFTDGDFDGWRVYTIDGNYSTVVASTKSGGTINLVLDVLDIDRYSNDGGATLTQDWVTVVPDAEEIIIRCLPEPTDTQRLVDYVECFPINQYLGTAKLELVVYKSICLYNIQYKYKTLKTYTDFTPIPSDTVTGYYAESSFEIGTGLIKEEIDRQRKIYTSDESLGFIELVEAPHSFNLLRSRVDRGDLVGITDYGEIGSDMVFRVGLSTTIQRFINTNAITANRRLILRYDENTKEGNIFTFWFQGSSTLLVGGYTLHISQQQYVNGVPTGGIANLINFLDSDLRESFYRENGIMIHAIFKSGSGWQLSKNYTPRTDWLTVKTIALSSPGDAYYAGSFEEDPTNPIKYRIDRGMLEIEGVLFDSLPPSAGPFPPTTTLFTLPVGYRPIRDQAFLVANLDPTLTTNPIVLTCYINTAGDVEMIRTKDDFGFNILTVIFNNRIHLN